VYELSCEHHVRNETRLDGVENWELNALQTEEERGESGNALPLEIDRSRNITVANYHGYRVISSYVPFPYALKVSESTGIRIRNMHVDSNSKVSFDNSVYDGTHHVEIRARKFAVLDVPGVAMATGQTTAGRGSGAQVEARWRLLFDLRRRRGCGGYALLCRHALATNLQVGRAKSRRGNGQQRSTATREPGAGYGRQSVGGVEERGGQGVCAATRWASREIETIQ
jgi:hypothetical protein